MKTVQEFLGEVKDFEIYTGVDTKEVISDLKKAGIKIVKQTGERGDVSLYVSSKDKDNAKKVLKIK